MESVLFALNILAALLFLIGYVRIIIEAFSVSAIWGLACVFFPGVAVLIFVALNWDQTKTPFIAMAVAIGIFVGSMVVAVSRGKATAEVSVGSQINSTQPVK